MGIAWQVIMLGGGLALLLRGAKDLIDGASALALRLGVSPLLVGLTVVAFGTSSPELVTSLLGALRAARGEAGAASIVVGNMVGSNACNIGLILGLAAAISPITVSAVLRRRDIPWMLVITGALALAAWTTGLGRPAGLLLLGLFAAATVSVLRSEIRGRHVDHGEDQIVHEAEVIASRRTAAFSTFQVVAGLAALAVGAYFLVEGAVGLARRVGISEAVIGLTIVAIGTSLPELATSVTAARIGHSEIALGNVVGSNVFNVGAGLGVPALVTPLHVPAVLLHRDLGVMVALTTAMAILCSRPKIGRAAGGALLLSYGFYLAWCLRFATA